MKAQYVNDALTIPDDAPRSSRMLRMQSWPAGRSLPKVSTYFHLHQLHRDNLDQVASLETRVKYDKGLVDATGGDLEVAQFLVVFIIAAVIVLKM